MTYMQTTAVEASSLSSLASIASQPPLDPTGPVPPPALPLVLYIARVPGSRDVFLTPIKPREKIVTAEDVQSSLYYVHINCEDERPRPSSVSPDSSNTLSAGNQDYNTTTLPPPLPARQPREPFSPPYPVHDQMPDRGYRPQSQQKVNRIARKPLLTEGSIQDRLSHLPASVDLPALPPRPLPALPDEHNHNTSLHVENVHLLRYTEHSEDANPYIRKYDSIVNASLPDGPDDEPGALTLIRRDPGSGEQWNVASIRDPPVHEVSSTVLSKTTAARRVKKGGAPLYLDLTNPGYAAFIDSDRAQSRTSTSSGSSNNDALPEGIFRRRLYMPGSRYGEHSYSRRMVGSDHSSSGSNNDMRKSMHEHAYPDLDSANSTPPAHDRRSKGYTFSSPWGGHCEFSPSATGKSLKCFHILGRHSTTDVSELRFNLPTKHQSTPAANKRSSYFSHQRHQSLVEWEGGVDAPKIMLDEDGRIDRSLGQEKAGGGFGGKQAKLGKLIIEPEGLKMLDLLVAANMGLWWRAYERL